MAVMARVVMGQKPAQAPPTAGALAASEGNQKFYNYIFVILGALTGAMIIYRVLMESTKYVRKITSLNNETQRYFAQPNMAYAKFKRHFLYAPIGSKRHNREIQVTKAVNVGTLPTRFQFLFLIAYFATNVIFTVLTIEWSQPVAIAAKELRNRSGILCMVNMVCTKHSVGIIFTKFNRFLSSLWQLVTTP